MRAPNSLPRELKGQLRYRWDDLVATHAYDRPHLEAGRLFHGGFFPTGDYVSPRMLGRGPAIEAWQSTMNLRGWPLIDASREAHPADDYPNAAQVSLLLRNGCVGYFWDILTITAVFEAKGETMRFIPPIDLQALVVEDIGETATGHLWKGLFWAHGVDEAGDREAPEQGGGHKQMWFAIRDLLFEGEGRPSPKIPQMYDRPAASREMPQLPEAVERLLITCMGVIQVEVRSFAFADFCLAVLRDPANFPDRSDKAATAIRLIERIVADEASHIAYLQTFISELRSFTFVGREGQKLPGAQIIDPVWESILAWPSRDVRMQRRADIRSRIQADVESSLSASDAQSVLNRFDALASL